MELLPGLAAEAPKIPGPGAGLCPGRTIGRAILDDAAILIRGDRYYTDGFTTAALTTWGFKYATNFTPGQAKGMIGNMLFKLLGHYYSSSNSVYALFPFMTPAKMREVLEEEGTAHLYEFTRPPPAKRWVSVDTWAAVRHVLSHPALFKVPYESNIEDLARSQPHFIFGENDPKKHGVESGVIQHALYPDGWERQVRSYFGNKTNELLREFSTSAPNGVFMVNVVRHVINVVYPCYFAKLAGIPLREDFGNVVGFTQQELFLFLAAQYSYVFNTFGDHKPVIDWQLREAASKTGELIHSLIKTRVISLKYLPGIDIVNNVTNAISRRIFGNKDKGLGDAYGLGLSPETLHFYRTIIRGTSTVEEATNIIHSICIGAVSTQAQQLSQIIEFYLREENAQHLERIAQLCKKGDEHDEELRGYLYEAMRLNPQQPVIPRNVVQDTSVVVGRIEVHLRKGDGVFASQKEANLDPQHFDNPLTVDPTRPHSQYNIFGFGMHACVGAHFADVSLLACARAIFSLPQLRLGHGSGGSFRQTSNKYGDTDVPIYITDGGLEFPFPTSLLVVFGGEDRKTAEIMYKADQEINKSLQPLSGLHEALHKVIDKAVDVAQANRAGPSKASGSGSSGQQPAVPKGGSQTQKDRAAAAA